MNPFLLSVLEFIFYNKINQISFKMSNLIFHILKRLDITQLKRKTKVFFFFSLKTQFF